MMSVVFYEMYVIPFVARGLENDCFLYGYCAVCQKEIHPHVINAVSNHSELHVPVPVKNHFANPTLSNKLLDDKILKY